MLKTLTSRLIFSYVAVVLLALFFASVALLVFGIQYQREDAYARLGSNLYLLVPQVRPRGEGTLAGIRDAIETQVTPQLEATGLRLLLLSSTGEVLFDSQGDDAIPDNINLTRSRQQGGQEIYYGSFRDGLRSEWLFIAASPRELFRGGPGNNPNEQNRPDIAFRYIVLAEQTPTLLEVWREQGVRLWPGGVAALLVALLLGLLLARSITRPVAHLTRATRSMAGGNFNQQVPLEGSREFVALADHFNLMAAEVERTRLMQHDFIANISHDLKSPLTSIQGFSQAMLDGAISNPAGYASAARVINDEALRMSRLVSDLLDLARIQSGEIKIEPTRTDVAALIRQAASVMQPQATERHVELRVEAGPLPPVLVDPDRMHRAVTNLIDNALRHTPPEGRVTVRGEVAPGAMIISVRDTGEGIPAEDLPRIFERFYQVDKSRATKGGSTGLGLAIVHEIVAGHGGQISVQSQPDVGTEFRITLPVDSDATRKLDDISPSRNPMASKSR